MTPDEWVYLRETVDAAARADPTRFGEVARWFLTPAEQRPLRPGSKMLRRDPAPRLITPASGVAQIRRAMEFDPGNPLAHLALSRFTDDPAAATFLRRWAMDRLPHPAPAPLQRLIEELSTPRAGKE